RLRSRLVEIDEKSARPAAVAIVVTRQGNAILAPLESAPAAKSKKASAQAGHIALLQLDQLQRLAVERCAQHHEMVTKGSFGVGIAAIKRLCQDQGSRL